MVRITGKELDEETGFYYYAARYMDPRTSRWISTDPTGMFDVDEESKTVMFNDSDFADNDKINESKQARMDYAKEGYMMDKSNITTDAAKESYHSMMSNPETRFTADPTPEEKEAGLQIGINALAVILPEIGVPLKAGLAIEKAGKDPTTENIADAVVATAENIPLPHNAQSLVPYAYEGAKVSGKNFTAKVGEIKEKIITGFTNMQKPKF